MRHLVSGKKLNRTKKHRKALFANLMTELIEHGRINTTHAKAKAVQGQVEKLISKAQSVTVSGRRDLAKVFGKRQASNLLVEQVAKAASDRKGGYTRIINLGERRGDNTMMARIELVDFKAQSNEASPKTKAAGKTDSKKAETKVAKKTPAKKAAKKE